MEEAKLLRRLRAGDETALEEIIGRYSAYVTAILRNKGVESPQDVEELAADVFVSLWRNGGEVRPGRLRPWLGAVARNRAVDLLRRQRQELPLEEDAVCLEDGLWERMSRQERTRLVQEALGRLSSQDREIFLRRYDLCQSSRQIAGAMGIPASTVRSRLSRGRQTLKQFLEQGGIHDEAAL